MKWFAKIVCIVLLAVILFLTLVRKMEMQDLNQKMILNIVAVSFINILPGNSISILLPVELIKLLALLPNYATSYHDACF